MEQAPSIGYTKSFDKACKRLDNAYQKKTLEAVVQFVMESDQQKRSKGQNLEALKDSPFYSIRVDDAIRIILSWRQKENVYVLLYVGQHDDAYNWAKNVTVAENEIVGTLQLYETVTVRQEPESPTEQRLFQAYSDKELKSIGVPEAQLPLVRTIRDQEQLRVLLGVFPEATAEYLEMLAEGIGTLSEILKLVQENKEISGGDVMKNPDTLRTIVTGYLNPELEHVISQGDLEEWRIFLHPDQRWLVRKRFDGPALVLGGAGTGKTVTAIHRAKALAARMIQENTPGTLLFTFFNDHLIEDITGMLRGICTAEEFKRIRVLNIDKEIFQKLPEVPGYEQVSIVYPGPGPGGQKLDKMWEDAVAMGDPEHCRSVQFYREEWDQIVTEMDVFTLEDYRKVSRTGRKKPLYPDERAQVWKVFEAYRQLMKERRLMDNRAATDAYRRHIVTCPQAPYRYVIVDEVQDFSAGALRLVRALAGAEHADDLFLVGDTRQRIYSQRTSLASCGIQVQGRTKRLQLNYRTTHQIQKAALHLLEGETFDDLNGGTDDGSGYRSCITGEEPQVRSFASQEEEGMWILAEMEKLTAGGVAPEDICLTAPTNQLCDEYSKILSNLFRVYELKLKSKDDRGMAGIRVGTMYRVKGLEFKYMFIAGVNKGKFPSNPADWERTKRQRCLMYVALTRAQMGAYVSGCGKAPSPFLTELMTPERS